ncbi:MAG: response regulator transcription factor [Tissierellia bacterium]|jgi:DNA-binding NarL/FixJ family response regulator|nr:response regulator transcription factor [Tissierellia bacterium]
MILILDDHPLSRQGLSSLIKSYRASENITETGTVNESILIMKKHPVDLAFVDINLGSESGFSLIKWIKSQKLKTKIFIITSSSRLCDFIYAQELAVDAYVLKDAFIDEIAYGLKTVERGGKFFSSAIMENLNKKSDDEKLLDTLTERELDVLSLINQGYNNEKISKTLYISEGTVKKHITSILSKLNLRSRVDAVIFANKNSYLMQYAIDKSFKPNMRKG